MKRIFTFSVFLFFLGIANAQLYKGTWLLGGSGKLYSNNGTRTTISTNITSKNLDVELLPSVGYFVTDKFAAGLRSSFYWTKTNADNGSSVISEKRLSAGPFARYYFLNAEKQFNLLTDVSYLYGVYRFYGLKGTISTFSLMAGPEIFFSESVGFEFLLGYSSKIEDVTNAYKDTRKGLQVTIGFQFHVGGQDSY